MMRTSGLLLFLLCLPGCYDSSLSDGGQEMMDTGVEEAFGDDTLQAVNLRFDILPPEGLINRQGDPANVQPQTFVSEIRDPVELTLRPSVAILGEVTGDATTPLAPVITTPGVSGPVPGTVQLVTSSPIMGAVSRIDDDGFFEAQAVPSVYGLAVVPDDGHYPLYVVNDFLAEEDPDFVLDIGSGHPVWGQVLTENGTPMAGVEVALRSTALDLQGPSVFTDLDGRYTLYASAGEFNLVSLGRNNGRDPSISSAAFLLDTNGVNLDVSYGSLDLVSLSGRLVRGTGTGVGGSTVRLTAQELTGYVGSDAGVVVEIPTDASGNFDARLVTGQYRVDLLPPNEAAVSPVSLGTIDITSAVDLGAIEMPDYRTYTGLAVDAAGQPLAGASLRATEVGFDGRYTSTLTDADGQYVLEAPVADLELLLTPPGDRSDLAATRYRFATGTLSDDEELMAIEGRQVTGTIQWDDLGRDEALSFAIVQVYSQTGEPLGQTLTDASGSYSLQVDLQAFE
jgi:hypothetical protein